MDVNVPAQLLVNEMVAHSTCYDSTNRASCLRMFARGAYGPEAILESKGDMVKMLENHYADKSENFVQKNKRKEKKTRKREIDALFTKLQKLSVAEKAAFLELLNVAIETLNPQNVNEANGNHIVLTTASFESGNTADESKGSEEA